MKKSAIFIVLLSLTTFGVLAQATVEMIPFSYEQVKVEGELGSFNVNISSRKIEDGLETVRIEFSSEKPATPSKVYIKWSFPSESIIQFWNSNISTDKVTYYNNNVKSRASSQVPLVEFIGRKDENRFLFAWSDALNKINTYTWLREEDRRFYCSIELFSEPQPEMTSYTLELRIDRRALPFYEAIKQTMQWFASPEEYRPAPVPGDAKMPMYSTWYNFHQNLDVQEVLKECRIGKKFGLAAVIIDDGWQTLDNKRGYAYTGDWQPERIGNMKAFTDSLHTIGMKVLIWYSLPFIGEKAKIFNKFKGKYLHHWESQNTYVLDPRYPEVREHIITTYEKALKDWNLDGFKLDFLGWFYADEKTVMTAGDGRDYASVNEATDRLMTDIMKRLRKINPDILIEFRQPYIGPLMRKYGNMFRAADCPNMAVVNRVRTTDLRISSGNTAVHSDMFTWNINESTEDAALQILNIIFAVPQLSVKLDSITGDQSRMVEFWINYWLENREVLLDGHFQPHAPGALYPLLESTLDNKKIIGVYQPVTVEVDKVIQNIDIINASGEKEIVMDLDVELGECNVTVKNCMGETVSQSQLFFSVGVHKLECPLSGLVEIRKL